MITVRPFNHIGPGQIPNFAVPALAKRIVEADRPGPRPSRSGNLSARRDFTDVRDVVRAYRLLIESGEPGAVYNVCSGRDVVHPGDRRRAAGPGRHHARARDRPGADPAGRGPRAAGRSRPPVDGHRLEAGDPPRPDPGRRARLLARARRLRPLGRTGTRRRTARAERAVRGGPSAVRPAVPVARPASRLRRPPSGSASGSGCGPPWPGRGPAWPGHGPGSGSRSSKGRRPPRCAR